MTCLSPDYRGFKRTFGSTRRKRMLTSETPSENSGRDTRSMSGFGSQETTRVDGLENCKGDKIGECRNSGVGESRARRLLLYGDKQEDTRGACHFRDGDWS